MDKKLIEQYGEDILSYRLRTARQKKRMQYEDFDKQLLRLHREHRALDKQIAALGWEPLVPPIQKGWKRFFILREDIARTKQAAFYENILKKINTYDLSHRKDFKVKKRRGSRFKKMVVKQQYLLRPSDWHFRKLGFSDAEKQLFHEVYVKDKRGQAYKIYVFNEPWRFVLRVRPNMIDKVRIRDSELEARIKGIREYLERNIYDKRLDKLLYGEGRYKLWKDVGGDFFEKYQFKNKSLHQIMDIIRET
jgi:hypothetical protein